MLDGLPELGHCAMQLRARVRDADAEHRGDLGVVQPGVELERDQLALVRAEPADVEAAPPEDAAEAALRRAAVRAALAQVGPRERELIALKFHAGLDNAEIAAVLGISVSNAGTQLHRAMTKLREAVEHA